MSGGQGTLRLALAFAALLGALALVVHRQSQALVKLRELDALRSDRALLEAERADLLTAIQVLESRARVVRDAGERLGLRVPAAAEIVIIPVLADPAEPSAGGARTTTSAAAAPAGVALGGRP